MGNLLREAFKREEISITHEMIEQQHNDYVVTALNEIFLELINEINGNSKIKKSSDLYKDSKTLQLMNKLDYTIEERFGIPLKTVAVDGSYQFSVLINSPKDVEVLDNTMTSDVLTSTKEVVEQYRLVDQNTKDKRDVNEISMFGRLDQKDNLDLIYNYRKSLLSLRDKLKTGSVFVDRKKGKIIGLPSDLITYLEHDFVSYVKKVKLTAEELTGCVLHEVGHAFTIIEYAYRSVTNTSVLIDTFLENIDKKNKTPKDSLILAYEKVSGDTSTEYKTKDATTATIYMLDSFLKENRFILTGTAHSSVDAEQLADQFMGRFGVGEYVITALEKMHGYFNKQEGNNMFKSNIFFCFWLVSTTVFAILMYLWGMGFLTVIAVLTIIAGVWGKLFIHDLSVYDSDPGYAATVDDNKRRYTRIRNELVRRLRTSESASKASVKSMIDSLDKVDAILQSVPDTKVSLIDSIIRKLSSSTKHRLEIRNIERMIEDLSENNLYVAAAKIQNKL